MESHQLDAEEGHAGGAVKAMSRVTAHSICRGQDARTWMLQDEVPILKLLSVDGSAASAIMV
ncbi:hypothetical protein STEG23_005473, partial [Scotinomys teguina]